MKTQDFVDQIYLPHIRHHLKPLTVKENDRILTARILPKLPAEIEVIGRPDVLKWHMGMSDTPVMANRALAVLSSVMRLAMDHEIVQANPCHKVKLFRERPRERFFSPGEQQAICDNLTQEPGDILIGLLLTTGARPGEFRNAAWDWITGPALRLPDAKRGPRTVYLSAKAIAYLQMLPEPHTGKLFKKWPHLPRAWARVRKAAGLKPTDRPYDLRHTFASNALRKGVNLTAIGMVLGHRQAQTTMRYAHLAAETGLEVAAKANGDAV